MNDDSLFLTLSTNISLNFNLHTIDAFLIYESKS